MRKFSLFLLAIVFLFSCHSEKEKSVPKPDDMIEHDVMVQVLADVHLLEGALLTRLPAPAIRGPMMHDPSFVRQLPPDSNKIASMPYYDIFKKRGVTRRQYESTMKWYCANPDELSALYDEVIAELTKRQANK